MEFLPSIIQSKGHQYVIIMFIDIHRCNLLLNIHKYMTHVYIIYDIYIYIYMYICDMCIYIYIHVALVLLASSSPFASIYTQV